MSELNWNRCDGRTGRADFDFKNFTESNNETSLTPFVIPSYGYPEVSKFLKNPFQKYINEYDCVLKTTKGIDWLDEVRKIITKARETIHSIRIAEEVCEKMVIF